MSVSKDGGKGTWFGKDLRSERGYNPTQVGYHPVEDACWQRGQK